MMTVESMTPADLPEVLALWRLCEGVGLGPGDSVAELASYLDRNPGLSFVVRGRDAIEGAVIAGHDGRRGYLHHLAVAAGARRRGIGTALVGAVERGLAAAGIAKCHLFVKATNPDAVAFWARLGWIERTDLRMFSRELG
jgi:N-acetylglutamate synthase